MRRLPAALLFCLYPLFLFAQVPDTLWTHIYGDSIESSTVRGAILTPDGGMAVTGTVCLYDHWEEYPSFILKTDSAGAVEWFHTYDWNDWVMFDALTVLPTGELVVSGGTGRHDPSQSWYYTVPLVVKTNASGDTLWTREFSSSDCQRAQAGNILLEGDDLVVAGVVRCHPEDTTQAWFLTKLDASGAVLWNRTFEADSSIQTPSLTRAATGGYFLNGSIGRAYDQGDYAYVIRTDADGNCVWRRSYPSVPSTLNLLSGAHTSCAMADGGLVFSAPAGFTDRLVRIDGNGDTLWVRNGGQGVNFGQVAMHPAGGFVLAGDWLPGPYYEALLIRISDAGELLWYTSAGLDRVDLYTGQVVIQRDGGYALWGNADLYYTPRTAIRIGCVRFEAEPLATPPVPPSLTSYFQLLAAYPNPFNAATQIRYSLPREAQVSLRVFDVLGRQAAVLVEGMQPAGEQSVAFEARGLASGLYFVRFEAAGRTATRKLVLMK